MTTVVFDLGGVVVLWDPVPAIAAVVGQKRAQHFVHGGEFDFAAWNLAQDSGRSWADAETAATTSHPTLAEEIAAYRPNFALSLRGLVPGTAGILRSLHERGVRLVALTNWSAETIHHGPEVFEDGAMTRHARAKAAWTLPVTAVPNSAFWTRLAITRPPSPPHPNPPL